MSFKSIYIPFIVYSLFIQMSFKSIYIPFIVYVYSLIHVQKYLYSIHCVFINHTNVV